MSYFKKIHLQRSPMAWLLHGSFLGVAILILFFTGQMLYCIPLLVLLLASDISQSFFLTSDYFQKGEKKILLKDVIDVRSFFFWLIVVDHYGDTISFLPAWLKKNHRDQVLEALGLSTNKSQVG
jgi:hypothetical protein